MLQAWKHEDSWPVGLTALGRNSEPEQSCNERDLPRDVALWQPP